MAFKIPEKVLEGLVNDAIAWIKDGKLDAQNPAQLSDYFGYKGFQRAIAYTKYAELLLGERVRFLGRSEEEKARMYKDLNLNPVEDLELDKQMLQETSAAVFLCSGAQTKITREVLKAEKAEGYDTSYDTFKSDVDVLVEKIRAYKNE